MTDPEARLAAVEELVAASRDLIIVRYRWVHQTGGKPTTDEDMENANARHYKAAEAAAEVLPTLAADLALAAAVRHDHKDCIPRECRYFSEYGFIRRWVWDDGHRESIALAPDDEVGIERRKRFAAYRATIEEALRDD